MNGVAHTTGAIMAKAAKNEEIAGPHAHVRAA